MNALRLLVWRHLVGEPVRTAVTVLGVALGVAVYTAVATANAEVLRSFEQAVLAIAGRTTLQVTGGPAGLGGFDERVIEKVQRADAVRLATPVVEIFSTWRAATGVPVPLAIMGVDLLAESAVRDYRVEDAGGSDVEWERYLDPDAIFLGRRFADRHGITVGAALDVQAGELVRRVRVLGILEGKGPGRATLEEVAVMDIAAAQMTFNRVGRLDRIDVLSEPTRPVEEVQRRVQALLPAGLVVKRPDQRSAQIERMTRAFRLNVTSLSAVALLVGLFLVYNTMSFAVVRRRREIGILRSLGVLPREVAGLFLVEAVAIGVVGGGLGVGLGLILSQGALRTIALTVSNLYGASVVPHATGIPPGVVARSLLIGIGVAVIGSWGPIRQAGAVVPVQALAPGGYESDAKVDGWGLAKKAAIVLALAGLAALPGTVSGLPIFGYVSVLLLLVGFACLSPAVIRALGPCLMIVLPHPKWYLARIAAGELDRAPVRSAVAVSALMVGLALVIGMSVMIHSFRLTVDQWLEQTVKADLIVASPTWLHEGPAGTLPESVRRRLQDVPGVEAADSYRDIRMEFRDMPVTVVARDLMLHARYSRYLFLKGESGAVLAEAVRNDQVLISETLASQLNLRRGERIALPGPHGPVEFSIAGVFYDYSTDGGKIVLDRTLYERHWEDPRATVVPLYLAAGADPEMVRRLIADRLKGDPPMIVLTNVELKREVLQIFDQTFAITYALEIIAVTVALLAIVNTLLTGIMERRSELAVLRVIGGTPGQIARMILWESGLLGVAGTVLGLVAGLAVAVLLIEVINKQSFGWTIMFHLSPMVLLTAAAVAIPTTLLAGYWPARKAIRLSVAESLHYE